MEKTQLLCTFTKKRYTNSILQDIRSAYLSTDKIFILQNCDDENEFYLTYNVIIQELKDKPIIRNTISVHRNKSTNTIYTINAINSLILLLNDGVADSTYKINWDNYKNSILVTNEEGFKKICTKIFKIC